ncbi:unnamed protein product [Ophioblennius macclurei]
MAAQHKVDAKKPPRASSAMTEYCAELQRWMWHSYWGAAGWHSWATLSAPFPVPHPPGTGAHASGTRSDSAGVEQQVYDTPSWHSYPYLFNPSAFCPLPPPLLPPPGWAQTEWVSAGTDGSAARTEPQQDGGTPGAAGCEFTIPSPLQRFLAETVDFCILFCVKVTIVLWIMHLSGMKDITKFITQFIVVEIDENTSMEDIEKILAVALAYRVLVFVYETICIWGAGGATLGKFLLGLRVVTYDTSSVVEHNRVLVVPATNVSLSASAVRALKKNLSIAFLIPVFITLFFFRHNRTAYDIMAGTIVVQRRGAR